MKVTVPVAAEGETLAVNVTDVPYVEGFADELRLVDVFVFPRAAPTMVADTRTRASTRQ